MNKSKYLFLSYDLFLLKTFQLSPLTFLPLPTTYQGKVIYILELISLLVDEMTEVVVKIPTDLEHRMKELPEVDWSSVARVLIRGEVSRLVLLKSIVSKSKLTEEDALELGKKVNEGLAKRYNKLLEERGL